MKEMMERMMMLVVIDWSGVKSQAFLIPKPKISPVDDIFINIFEWGPPPNILQPNTNA